MYYEEMVTN